MNSKTKTTIITALLMLAMVSGAVAQEKWEYAIVKQFLLAKTVLISIGGQPVKQESVSSNCHSDCNGLLLVVQRMTDEGWEVINATCDGNNAFYYFLKRKTKP